MGILDVIKSWFGGGKKSDPVKPAPQNRTASPTTPFPTHVPATPTSVQPAPTLSANEALDVIAANKAAKSAFVERREKPRVNARDGTRVLIIDDSPTIVALLKRMLEQNGYKALEAMDAESGIAAALSELPDLIFLDIVLPGMNGFEALRRLRREIATKTTPIVMISGNELATEQFYAQRIGADDFMKKPFSRSEVFARIERLLDAEKVPRRHLAVIKPLPLAEDTAPAAADAAGVAIPAPATAKIPPVAVVAAAAAVVAPAAVIPEPAAAPVEVAAVAPPAPLVAEPPPVVESPSAIAALVEAPAVVAPVAVVSEPAAASVEVAAVAPPAPFVDEPAAVVECPSTIALDAEAAAVVASAIEMPSVVTPVAEAEPSALAEAVAPSDDPSAAATAEATGDPLAAAGSEEAAQAATSTPVSTEDPVVAGAPATLESGFEQADSAGAVDAVATTRTVPANVGDTLAIEETLQIPASNAAASEASPLGAVASIMAPTAAATLSEAPVVASTPMAAAPMAAVATLSAPTASTHQAASS